ncbi:MAG: DUF885 domain-containing protein [Bryobacteraceae bacterium]|nr:DUF885 domain-containing protein [Bryobacteraceae bacterium]
MTRRDLIISTFAVPMLAQQSGKFEKLADDYLQAFFQARPETATSLGEHRYDGQLANITPESLKADLARERDFLHRARSLETSRLDKVNQIDLRILIAHIERTIWNDTVLREREWNPMLYNPGSAIYYLLERDFAGLPERLKSVQGRLDAVPGYLAAARRILKTSTKIHAETAVAQTQGTINLITTVLDTYLAKAPAQSRTAIAPVQAKAVAALNEWREWMKTELLPGANQDFRIGPELYQAKLRHTLGSDLTAAQIRERADRDLKQTQAMIYDTASRLTKPVAGNRTATIRAVLDKLADQRPSGDTILGLAQRDMVEATEYVRTHNIVSLYESPLRILEMPEFQRGVAVASCASPGPLEKNGVTFFNISPPPQGWSEAQVTSYFREYNNSMTKNLVVHEAMPGHYLQRAHANRFKAPTLTRVVFSSGTFTEGWAVYAEKVMADAGFGGPEVRMQQLKMRLRTIINSLLDQGIHSRGMTEGQAMDMMLTEGFQERSEAAGKWRRAMLTSTQLSTYYTGTTELDGLREEYVQKHGPIQDEKAFNDRLLSFGSPAPRYIRELMGTV